MIQAKARMRMSSAIIAVIASWAWAPAPATAAEITIHCPKTWPTKDWKPGDLVELNQYTLSVPEIETRRIGTHWDNFFDEIEERGPMERRWKNLDPRKKYRMGCGYGLASSLVIDLPGRPLRCETISPREGFPGAKVIPDFFCIVEVDDSREADRVRIYPSEQIDGKTVLEGFRPHQDLAAVRRIIADGGWRVISETPREPAGIGKIAVIEIARGPATIALRFAKATDLLREVDYMEALIEDEFPIYDKASLRFGLPGSNDSTWVQPYNLPNESRNLEITHKRDYRVPNPKEHLIFKDLGVRE